jgi:hypothetical protein
MGFTGKKLRILSLGSGQEEKARELIKECCQTPTWFDFMILRFSRKTYPIIFVTDIKLWTKILDLMTPKAIKVQYY